MVYSDSSKRFLVLALILVIAVGVAAFRLWGDQINQFLSENFQTQVLSLTQDDQDFLLNLQGLAFLTPEEVATPEAFEARLLETLFTHAETDFDPEDPASAEEFLMLYYDMPDPLPAERAAIQDIITTAVDKFIVTAPLISNAGQTLLNDLLTILANHQAASNNASAVRRAQSTRAFMESIVKQL